jgi:hypothetical protein
MRVAYWSSLYSEPESLTFTHRQTSKLAFHLLLL